jgi:hypothetical protein
VRNQKEVDNLHFQLNDMGHGYYDATEKDRFTKEQKYTIDEIEGILEDK